MIKTTTKTAISAASKILAIDGATTSGYAIYRDGAITSGVWRFSKSSPVKRCWGYYLKVKEIVQSQHIDTIVIEDTYLDRSKIKAFIALGEMRGMMILLASQLNLNLYLIEPTAHKYHLTGKRYATKKQTIQAVNKLGFSGVTDDNEADAISILIASAQNQKLLNKIV